MDWINQWKIDLMEKMRKTDAMAYYETYKDNQWKATPELLQNQEDKLRSLMAYVYEKVPFYQEYMKENDIDPSTFHSLNQLQQMPIIDKDTIKRHKDKMLSNDIEDIGAEEKRTGGSTGEPMKYYVPKQSHSIMWANIWRGWNVTGYKPGDKVAVLAGGSLLSGFDVKRKVYYYLNNWIPFSSYDMSEETMKQYIKKLRQGNVEFLYGYSSSIYELANYILKNDYNLQLRGIITTSEVLLPHYRTTMEEAFHCSVYDQYGANDGGVTAFECEYHDGLHIGMERCVVEIVNDEGQPVPEGEEGRILLTDLTNYAMPFIRYEVGDYGALNQSPCPCGRGLIRFTHIKGRKQEFIYARGSRKVHGGFFSTTFRKYEAVEQFQVVQEEVGSVKIRLKLSDSEFEQQLPKIENQIKKQAELDEVEIITTDQFEKTKGGKHKFVINHVD